MKRALFKKGQHVVCKYRGARNGDLIVGVVRSARSDGHVLFDNLLTGTCSVKKESVALQRNVVVKKRDALRVVRVFQTEGKRAARASAVALADQYRKNDSAPDTQSDVDRVLTEFRALTHDEQQLFAREVFGDLLSVFGVE